MKKESSISLNLIDKTQLENLNQVVKEITGGDYIDQKQFSTVDLWSIQRKYKTMLNRRNH